MNEIIIDKSGRPRPLIKKHELEHALECLISEISAGPDQILAEILKLFEKKFVWSF